MKTIEQEIRERLAEQQLSPANVDAVMLHIKADPLCRGVWNQWSRPLAHWSNEAIESFWLSCWSSARDWIVQQITAPVTKEGG